MVIHHHLDCLPMLTPTPAKASTLRKVPLKGRQSIINDIHRKKGMSHHHHNPPPEEWDGSSSPSRLIIIIIIKFHLKKRMVIHHHHLDCLSMLTPTPAEASTLRKVQLKGRQSIIIDINLKKGMSHHHHNHPPEEGDGSSSSTRLIIIIITIPLKKGMVIHHHHHHLDCLPMLTPTLAEASTLRKVPLKGRQSIIIDIHLKKGMSHHHHNHPPEEGDGSSSSTRLIIIIITIPLKKGMVIHHHHHHLDCLPMLTPTLAEASTLRKVPLKGRQSIIIDIHLKKGMSHHHYNHPPEEGDGSSSSSRLIIIIIITIHLKKGLVIHHHHLDCLPMLTTTPAKASTLRKVQLKGR